METEHPLVSVIVPVYNAGRYLGETMGCILGQSLQNIEVICVDDGSTDDSPGLLKRFEAADSRVRVVSRGNTGAGAARNAGIAAAKGLYLSFLDADDRFEPDMLETAYRRCVQAGADIAVFRCDLFDDESGEVSPCPWAMRTDLLPQTEPFSWRDTPEDIFRLFNGWAWDKLFRAGFVKENGLLFQNLKTTNDMFFVMTALIKADRIVTVDKVLAHQRRNRASSISNSRAASWGCFYEALSVLQGEIRKTGLYPELERGFVNLALQHSLWQLNTLTGPAYEQLYNKLKGEWFGELGVSGHGEAYFFKPGWYRTYERMMSTDAQLYRNAYLLPNGSGGLMGRSLFLHPVRLLHRARTLGVRGTARQIKGWWRRHGS